MQDCRGKRRFIAATASEELCLIKHIFGRFYEKTSEIRVADLKTAYDRAKAMVCGNCNLDVPLRCNVTWSIQQLRLNVKRHVGHVELAKLTFWHESDKKPKGIKYARLQENKVLEGDKQLTQ
uniref:Uncharacterized protein n=1 Tax=Parascaris univalens TaxID=6257 RepID=A0A915AVF2_PARUN